MASKAILFSYTNYPQLTANLQEAGVKMGKDGLLRHGSFTFDLQGISRAASHQIVRHRIASFSQQSQRYVRVTRSYGYLKPPGIPEDLKVPVEIQGHTLELHFTDVKDLVRKGEDGFSRTPPGELFQLLLQPTLELVHPVETFVTHY